MEKESPQKENPLKAEKRRKLQALREKGINPFPYSFERNLSSKQAHQKFGELQTGEKQEGEFRMAGRILTKRLMGKAAFFTFQDVDGNFQGYVRTQELSEEDRFSFEHIDLGDIVGVSGFIFRTQKGELSIHCQSFELLCKTLEPLPEKYHGLADVDLRYRYRHLDLIMNPEIREVFRTRSKIISLMREFLDSRGFLEVETPILQPIYGGAAATPFTTHHKALDMKLYMKISPELYLKRLIVGGFDKVYDLNRCFRNEGIDRSHNPEFTMLEWYEAYTDYNYQMKQFEEIVAFVAKEIKGSCKFEYQGKEIDFTTPWKRLTMVDAIKEYGGVNVEDMTLEQLEAECVQRGGVKKFNTKGEWIAELFDLCAEEHLWNPVFIIDHPVEISPLTKKHRSKKGYVERFEPFAAGMEIGNSYSELNDPEDQRARLEEQDAIRQSEKDSEAHPLDEDFLHAIDVGMPPTGGVGIGIERIVMIMTDQPSIRDIIFFPTMKHKND